MQKKLLVLLALLVACEGGTPPQAPRFPVAAVVQGRVTSQGAPVERATVKITVVVPTSENLIFGNCRGSLQTSATALTDAAGFYRDTVHSGVSEVEACLVVEVSAAGFRPITASGTRLWFRLESPGAQLESARVDVQLEPAL